MTRIIAVLVMCGLVVAGCDESSTRRRGKYVSAAGKFSADLPGTPKETDQDVGTLVGPIAAHAVMGEDRSRVAYGVTYADYPANLVRAGNADATLEGACAGMVAAIKGKTLEKKEVTLGSHPGREVHFEVKPAGSTETGTGVARMYLVGNRLYQLLVVGSSSSFDDRAATSFFDSFQLQGDASAIAKDAPGTAPPDATPGPAPKAGTGPPPITRDVAGWGTAEDPDGDSRIGTEGEAATIEVPGTVHNLAAAPGKANAPRILRPVEGDFVAEVKVAREDRPSDPPAPGSHLPFHGAGLLLWGDTGNFIRLERAAFVRGGQLQQYVLFEQHAAGAPPMEQDAPYAGGPVSLRLERRGTQVSGSYSTDGMNWQPLSPKSFTSPHAKVGVAAVNTAAAPFKVRFEGLKVGKP